MKHLFQNKRLFILAIIFAAMCTLTNSAVAKDDGDISVKAEVNQAFITIGDPVEYTVTIKRSPSVQVLSAIQAPSSEILKIKKIEDIRYEEGGKTIEGKKFTLSAFRLGEFVLAPLDIQYRVGGGDPQTIQTDRIYLTVKSVAGNEEKTDIRGVKPVVTIKNSYKKLLLILVLLALTLIIFVIIYQRRRRATEPQEVVPHLSNEELALLELNQLIESDLIRKGNIKEYFLKLSEILRTYLEKRFNILAIEATTFEINRNLRSIDTSSSLREKIINVLESSDLAKFAKWKPQPSEILDLNKRSKEIIQEAKPSEVQGGI